MGCTSSTPTHEPYGMSGYPHPPTATFGPKFHCRRCHRNHVGQFITGPASDERRKLRTNGPYLQSKLEHCDQCNVHFNPSTIPDTCPRNPRIPQIPQIPRCKEANCTKPRKHALGYCDEHFARAAHDLMEYDKNQPYQTRKNARNDPLTTQAGTARRVRPNSSYKERSKYGPNRWKGQISQGAKLNNLYHGQTVNGSTPWKTSISSTLPSSRLGARNNWNGGSLSILR